MRIATLLLIALVSLASGCSAFIAGTGTDLTALKTKTEIHSQLGEPAVSGLADGHPFEEYHTRQKVSEIHTEKVSEGYAMLYVMTCGTAELILFPHELYHLASRSLLGETIRVTYNTAGDVTGRYLEGESLDHPNFCPPPDPVGPSSAAPPSQPRALSPYACDAR